MSQEDSASCNTQVAVLQTCGLESWLSPQSRRHPAPMHAPLYAPCTRWSAACALPCHSLHRAVLQVACTPCFQEQVSRCSPVLSIHNVMELPYIEPHESENACYPVCQPHWPACVWSSWTVRKGILCCTACDWCSPPSLPGTMQL